MRKVSWYYKFLLFKIKKKTNLDKFETFETKSLDQIFNYFGSDKGSKVLDPYSKSSSKFIGHGFGKFYEKHFKKYQNQKFNLLEIGTWEGASLASFHTFFLNAFIFGIDRNFKNKYSSKRLNFLYCNTTKKSDLKILINKLNNKKFKIIIDDGSHLLKDIIHNLNFFFKFVEKGGYYIIEDYNHPKYYKHLNDGNKQEPFIDEIIECFKKKKFFNSRILSKEDQKNFLNSIENIYTYKGDMIDLNKNVSDLLILKKKN